MALGESLGALGGLPGGLRGVPWGLRGVPGGLKGVLGGLCISVYLYISDQPCFLLFRLDDEDESGYLMLKHSFRYLNTDKSV